MGLATTTPSLTRLAPVLGVHGLAFPQRGNAKLQGLGCRSDDAVDMTADASAGDREAELLAIRIIALAGVEIDAGGAEPADGQILERMADGEDAQRLAGEVGAIVLRRPGELELQGALAGMADARAAQIVARWTGGDSQSVSAVSTTALSASAKLRA